VYKFLIQIFEIDFEIFVCLCSRSKMTTNGPALGAVAELEAQNCQYTTKVDAR
jgi:hypothetical protein